MSIEYYKYKSAITVHCCEYKSASIEKEPTLSTHIDEMTVCSQIIPNNNEKQMWIYGVKGGFILC